MFIEYDFEVVRFDNRRSDLMVKYTATDETLNLTPYSVKVSVDPNDVSERVLENKQINVVRANYRKNIILQSVQAQWEWNNVLRDRDLVIPDSFDDDIVGFRWPAVREAEFNITTNPPAPPVP